MKLIYFSPTKSTKKIVTAISKAWQEEYIEINLCKKDTPEIEISEQEICIIGVPVYSGRIPLPAALALKKIKANNTPAITIVSYGNRHYDDALLELNDICQEQGFNILASGAFTAPHSFDRHIAANHPTERDLDTAYNLGITAKGNLEEFMKRNIKVNGNHPYKELKIFPYHVIADAKCNDCGHCAKICPMEAIDKNNLRTSDKDLCVACMLCVSECPQNARHLDMPEEDFQNFLNTLRKKCEGKKKPELFY